MGFLLRYVIYKKLILLLIYFILNVHPIQFSESPRKSATPVHVVSPAVKSRWSFSSSKKSFGIYYKDLSFFLTHVLIGLGLCLMFSLVIVRSNYTLFYFYYINGQHNCTCGGGSVIGKKSVSKIILQLMVF